MGLSTSLIVTHENKSDFQKSTLVKFGYRFSEWILSNKNMWISSHHHDRFTAERSPNFVRMMVWLHKNGFRGVHEDNTFDLYREVLGDMSFFQRNFSFLLPDYSFSEEEDVYYALKNKQHLRKELTGKIKPEFIEIMMKHEQKVSE